MEQQFTKLNSTHVCDNYDNKSSAQQLATALPAMPALPKCPTFSTLLYKDHGHEVRNGNTDYLETCPTNDFITRKRSFYILTSLLVIGIIILVFIVVAGVVVYVRHTQQLALRPAIKNKICERTYCLYGAQCIIDEFSQQPYCRCEQTCPDTHSPVCGSDGQNYVNECQLKLTSCTQQTRIYVTKTAPCGLNSCEKLQCRFPQECKTDRFGNAKCVCLSSCPHIYKPVCGSDGVSYDTECDLHRQSCLQITDITIKHRGMCSQSANNSSQLTITKNLCSDKQCLFGSYCAVRGQQIVCECSQCSDESKPVCGSDHNSYANECKLKLHSCLNQKEITVVHSGYCGKLGLNCDGILCPYYSSCHLNKHNMAECICPQVCIRVDQPVCGSDGLTYENECELKVASCRLQTEIVVKFNGSCDLCHSVSCKYGARCENGRCVCPTDCPTEVFEPLCANDGNTYNNECEMKKAACHNELELITLFYGECEEVDETKHRVEGSGDSGNKIDESGNEKRGEIGSGLYMSGTGMNGMNANTHQRYTCENMNCLFDAICKYNEEAIPYCACHFDCLTKMKANNSDPVCGNDGKMYESECALKEESCKRQIEIFAQDIQMCNEFSLSVIPCNGQLPMIDQNTGDDISCEFSDNDCPLNSYCHKTDTFAVCCSNLDDAAVNCDLNPTSINCINSAKNKLNKHKSEFDECECNKHGAYLEKLCNPLTKQCNCKPGVGGLHCDRCDAGFWGLHKGNSGCIPCACNEFGSVRNDCEQTTGRCVCKHDVNGMKCDICPQGSVLQADGCNNASTTIPQFLQSAPKQAVRQKLLNNSPNP